MITSRLYDAKQAALTQAVNNAVAVEIFIDYLDADKCDIEHEIGMTCEEYIFGDDSSKEGRV